MRLLSLCSVASFTLVLTGCGSTTTGGGKGGGAADIVGKWEMEEKGVKTQFEFTADGKAKVTIGGIVTSDGTYKSTGTGEIETSAKGDDGKDVTQKMKYSVAGDVLTIKEDDGSDLKLKKVK